MGLLKGVTSAGATLSKWLFLPGLVLLVPGSIANGVYMQNPAANLYDLTFGGIFNFVFGDPKAAFALDPSMLIPASEVATGVNGVIAGIGGSIEGLGHIGHAFSEAVGAVFTAADFGISGGAFTALAMTFGIAAFTYIANDAADKPKPAMA